MMPVFLPDGRAGRLRGDQGALARHRRQGAVLHRHHRRLPGGHDLPGRQAVPPRRARRRHLPDGARQLARCRRSSPATSTPRSPACAQAAASSSGSSSATAWRRSRLRSSGCSTTARRSSAATSSKLPDGRYVGRGVMDDDGISTTSRSRSRSRVEIDGSTCRLDYSNAPDAQPGPVNCPLASTVSASRIAITMLAGGGRGAERGPLPRRSRSSRGRARCSTRCRRRRASSTAGRRCRRSRRSTDAVAEAMPEAVPRLQRRRHLRRSLVGRPRGHRRAWARRVAAPGRPGRVGRTATARARCMHHIEAATRFAPLEVWEAKNPG